MPARLAKEMGRWLRYQTPLTVAMESVAITGMKHPRGAIWAEAKTGAIGLKAGFSIFRTAGGTIYPSSKSTLAGAPVPMLTLLLWSVSRGGYRETVGNSAEECRGLNDLLVAQGQPASSKAISAVRRLRPTEGVAA